MRGKDTSYRMSEKEKDVRKTWKARIWNIGFMIGIIAMVSIVLISQATFAFQSQQSEQEPNNDRSRATTIDVSSGSASVSGILGFMDEDWFAFEVKRGDRISIDYTGSPGQARIYAPDGTVLDSESPFIRQLGATAPEPGTYYLQLTTVAAANGDYSFSVQVSSPSTTTVQPRTTTTTGRDVTTTTGRDTTTAQGTLTTTTASDRNGDSSGDSFSDSCYPKSARSLPPGTYQDMLTPTDRDVIPIHLEKGEFITVNLTYNGPNESDLAIWGPSENLSISSTSGGRINNIPNFQDFRGGHADVLQGEEFRRSEAVHRLWVKPGNTQFRVYAESRGIICLSLHTVWTEDRVEEPEGSSDGGAGSWSLAYVKNEEELPNIATVPRSEQLQIMELESQVDTLEKQVDRLNSRVSRLENRTNTTTTNQSQS